MLDKWTEGCIVCVQVLETKILLKVNVENIAEHEYVRIQCKIV